MGGEVRLKSTSDNRELLAAFDAANKRIVALEKQLEATSAKSRKLTADERALGAQAKRVMEEVQAPAERYRQKLDQLSTLLQKGKIDAETYGRASVKAKAELLAAEARLLEQSKQTSAETRKAAKEQEDAAAAGKRVWEQTRTPVQRYNAELERLRGLLHRGAIDQNTYRVAVAQANDELRAVEEAGSNAFGSKALGMLAKLTTAIAGGAGLAAAWRVVTAEINASIEARNRAAQESMSVADAQAAALRNLGAETPEERDKFLGDIKTMSGETGVEEKKLFLLASDALSARGNLPIEQAMSAIRLGAQTAPDDVTGAGRAITGAALDISKISGATAEQATGFMMKTGQMARVTDTGKLAQTLPAALTAGAAHESDLATSGALYAALTGGMGNFTGQKSSTAMINFLTKLDEFLPDEASTSARISKLQQDPSLQRKFLEDSGGFEAAAQAPIEQIISGQGPTADAYRDFAGRMPSLDESGKFYQNWLGVYQSAPLQTTSKIGRAGEQMREGLQIADQDAARAGLMTKDLQQVLIDSGMNATGAKIADWQTYVAGYEPEDVLKTLEWRKKELEAGQPILGSGYQGGWYTGGGERPTNQGMRREAPTTDELEKAQVLGKYIEGIRATLAQEAAGGTGAAATPAAEQVYRPAQQATGGQVGQTPQPGVVPQPGTMPPVARQVDRLNQAGGGLAGDDSNKVNEAILAENKRQTEALEKIVRTQVDKAFAGPGPGPGTPLPAFPTVLVTPTVNPPLPSSSSLANQAHSE